MTSWRRSFIRRSTIKVSSLEESKASRFHEPGRRNLARVSVCCFRPIRVKIKLRRAYASSRSGFSGREIDTGLSRLPELSA